MTKKVIKWHKIYPTISDTYLFPINRVDVSTSCAVSIAMLPMVPQWRTMVVTSQLGDQGINAATACLLIRVAHESMRCINNL